MFVTNYHPLLHSHSHVCMANACVPSVRRRCDLLLCRGIITIQGHAEPTHCVYVCVCVYACMRVCVYVLVSSRLIDASMYRDTCHAICIAIQFATIAIPVILQHYCVFYLNVSQT